MKLDDVKSAMRHGEPFPPLFEEFKTALKRVRDKGSQCQHCYATAAELPIDQYENAVTLIRYGLENFAEDWLDFYRANLNLAIICEQAGKYPEAKNAYLAALSAVETMSQKEDYIPYLSAHLLRVEMHLSGFAFTDDLLSYYEQAVTDHSLTADTRKSHFYRHLAEIIIAQDSKQKAAVKEAVRRARILLNGEDQSAVAHILKRHRYQDEVQATDEAIAFLLKV